MKYTIRPQWYPCHDGSKPLSWAIYYGEEFLAYSWSIEGAAAALVLILECQRG
jgi:hypothetical protein